MRQLLLAVMLSAPTAAHAMAPATAKYLRQIGIDPKSKDAIAADAEGVITVDYDGDDYDYSLAQLAAAKKKNAVATFISTRAFIHRLEADYAGTEIPTKNYDPLYLRHSERELVGRKFAERFKKKS